MNIKDMLSRIPRVWWDRIIFVLKISIATGLIALLVASGRLNFRLILNSYKHTNYFLAGIFCCTLAIVTPIIRWWILTRMQKLPLVGFDALRLTMIGYFFNVFVPSGSGGDVVRAAYAVRDCPERRPQALSVAFVDRGLGLHALLLLGVSLILFRPSLYYHNPDLRPFLLLIAAMLAVGTLAPLFTVWKRTNGLLIRLCGRVIGNAESWHEALELYRRHPSMLCWAYLFSLGSAICNVLAIHFMMLAIGSSPSIFESLAIGPLIILANTLPLTPGGVGVAEGASAGLYALVGQAGGANGMLLLRCFIVSYALLGLPFFLISRKGVEKNVMVHNARIR